jgi:RNase P subunit RPR2
MSKKEISKTEAREKIKNFFLNIKQKSPKDFKKIKRIAMRYKISLKEYKSLFCKKCLIPYSREEKIRIKNKIKIVECENCGYRLRKNLTSSS